MFSNPWVAGVAVVMAGLVALGMLGGMTYLAATGKGTEAFGALVIGVLTVVLGRLRKIEHQTDSITSRAMDAVLPPAAPTSPPPASTVDTAQTQAQQAFQGGSPHRTLR